MPLTAETGSGSPAASGVPGTVHLVDLVGTLQVRHAQGHHEAHDIVLVPAPSSDPEDPLNWTRRRKILATFCNCVYTLMVGIASAAIYSVLVPISDATSLTIGDLNAGTGYMFLAFGWSCLFWQPMAQKFGKRPIYLISILATAAVQVWAPYTRSNGQWIANKVVQGFVGSPIESLCEVTMTDIHERGTFIALYGLLLAGSNFFAPIISGFIADGQGWQWVLYWCAIFNAAGFVFLFFFMEETNYSGRSTTVLSSSEPASRDNEKEPDFSASPHSPASPSPSRDHATQLQRPSVFHRLRLFDARSVRLAPSPFRPSHFLLPLYLLSFPVISYSGFVYGSSLIFFNILNATASSILASPPYSFPASLVGLSYIAAVIGVAAAALYTGPLGDRVVLRLARRNGGVMESEHRLWLLLPCVLLIPGGLILWGVGGAQGIHWVGLLFGMATVAWTNVVGLALGLSYALDGYGTDGMREGVVTAVILVRNSMSFAVSYGITPWIRNMGQQNAFITAGFAGFASAASVGVMIKWGKSTRVRTRARWERCTAKYGGRGGGGGGGDEEKAEMVKTQK